MIATALQGFETYDRFEVPFARQSDPARGQIKVNLPYGETVVSLDGYVLSWSSASLTQVRAVRLVYKIYGGHTAFEWVPPPLDVPATLWLFDALPAFGGVGGSHTIQVTLIPFRF